MASSNVYSALDPSSLLQDRRAISEKLRRHQLLQRGSSQRQGGYDMEEQSRSEESTKLRTNVQSYPQRRTSVNSNLDPSVLAQDRQAIGEKLRRHQQMQKQGSQRQGGYEDENETAQLVLSASQMESQSNIDYDDDMSESIDVLKITLGKDGGSIRSFSKREAFSKNKEKDSTRMRRHDSHRSPIIDTTAFSIPHIATDVPTTQGLDKTLFGCLYIILCIALLISYAFFLESCKLMNYGV
jgi:hypothetical protein